MTTQVLSSKITIGLKKYLKSLGHIDSGDLYKSINTKVTLNPNLIIKINGLEYIKYLDDGKLLENYFQLDSTIELITEFTVSQIELIL